MDLKAFLKNFDTIAEAPNGIPKLRSLILDLAVRGKLVPQNPEDEHVNDFLDQISQIKEEITEWEGLPKEKALPPVKADEYLHDLPYGWIYTRLGNFSFFLNGYAFKSETYTSSSIYQLIRLGNVKNDVILLDQNPIFIPENVAAENQKFLVRENDLLITMTGTKSKRDFCFTAVVKVDYLNDRKLYLNQRVGCIRVLSPVSVELINIFLKSSHIVDFLLATATGTANQANIGVAAIRNLPIPIPPPTEQKRIVAKVNELMQMCDRLEAAKQTRDTLRQKLRGSAIDSLMNAETDEELQKGWAIVRDNWVELSQSPEDVGDLRRSILQLAVRGKLVAQNSADESVLDLLVRITNEKKILIEAKKIRDTSTLPLKNSSIPCAIPNNWDWKRFGDVLLDIEAGTSPQCEKRPKSISEWGVIKISAVSWDKFNPDENKALPANLEPRTEFEINSGDFIMSRANTSELVGKSVVVEDTPPRLLLNDKTLRVLFPTCLEPKFFNLYNNSELARQYYAGGGTGTSDSMKNITREQIRNLPIPLPPLAEQKRIVAKVDELMQMCDRLEESLRQSQQQAAALAASAISHLKI